MIRFPFVSEPATFLARPNRYLVIAKLRRNGETIYAHCPNPGRLGELLLSGATIYVSAAVSTLRKTQFDLRFVEHPQHGQLISLDTRLPNQLFAEGLRANFFPAFCGYQRIEHEVSAPTTTATGVHSRFDYRLSGLTCQPCWVEVKSASLVEERCARFPDAVTERGRRHLRELITLRQQGDRAAVVFIVQRPDADCLAPQWTSDPQFAQTLVDAAKAGVELYAYTCHLTPESIQLASQIPVISTPS